MDDGLFDLSPALVMFTITRHCCMLRVEDARALLSVSGLAQQKPTMAQTLDELFNAISVMVSEVKPDAETLEREKQMADRITTLTAERDEARAKAIAEVVAWLRETWRTDMGEIECLDIADAIEAGEWEK